MAPRLPDQHRVELDLDDIGADDGVGQRDDQRRQRVDIGSGRPRNPVEQGVAPQLGQSQAYVVGRHRREQVGDVAPHLGRHASEAERDQPADRWVTAHGDQHLGDHIGNSRFDEVPLGRRHRRQCGGQFAGVP